MSPMNENQARQKMRAVAPGERPAGLAQAAIIHEEPLKDVHLHGGKLREAVLEHFHPLLDGEKARLGRIAEDGDDDPVEDLKSSVNDIQMSVGDGVERTGINRCFWHEIVVPVVMLVRP